MAKIENTGNTKWYRKQVNSQTLVVRMQNNTTTFENGLAVSYRVKHTLTYHTEITYLPKR